MSKSRPARKNGGNLAPEGEHPLSLMFPGMEREEYDALEDSIRRRGLDEPITVYEGQILDGRHRFRACHSLQIKPRFTSFSGTEEEALQFVIDKNAARRHLTPSRRAAIAAQYIDKLPPAKRGEGKRRERVAKQFGISDGLLASAMRVLSRDPVSIGRIESGALSASAAERMLNRAGKQEPESDHVPRDTDKAAKDHLALLRRTARLARELWKNLREIPRGWDDLPAGSPPEVWAAAGELKMNLCSLVLFLREDHTEIGAQFDPDKWPGMGEEDPAPAGDPEEAP